MRVYAALLCPKCQSTLPTPPNNPLVYAPMDLMQNPTSPFYVHPNENPAASTVNKQLNSNNYHSWVRLMKKALMGKGKFRFVDGSPKVSDCFDPTYDAWECCNDIVHSWIINSVSPSIVESVMYMENAFDV